LPIALLCFASQGRLGRDESAEPPGVSRTTLRRIVPSFTVEVRRRPRLAATSRPNVRSLETKPPPVAFDPESHPAEAAAIGAKKTDQPSVDVPAPKGRILPSLVADEPLARLLRDASLSATESEPTSRTPKRQSVRPIKGKAHTFKPPRSSESSPAKSTPLADELSTASRQPTSARSDEGIGVPPSDPTTVLRTKAKQRDKIPNSRDHGRATPLLNSQRSSDYSGRAEVPLSALVLVVNPIHRGARRWSAPTGDAMSLHGQSAQPAT